MAKSDITQFDYRKVAQHDADMWRSYYNHQFFKLFTQALRLTRDQLGFNWFLTLKLSYHAAWAAADYRLNKGKENYPRTLKNLIKLYKIISKNCTEPFDFKKAAELELEWWDIHRYPDKYPKTLEQSLADAMAVIYSVKPSANLTDYAHRRAVAMMIPDHHGDDHATPIDWPKVNKLLLESWKSLRLAIQK
jgi:hypothetical protein